MAYLKACASRLDGGRAHGVRREAPWYPSVRLLGMFWHEKTSVCLGTYRNSCTVSKYKGSSFGAHAVLNL